MPNKKLKAVHIHTDYKFVYGSLSFEGNYFENEILIIQNNYPYNGVLKDKALIFSTNKKDLQRIIQIAKTADLVVLYDLDLIKSRIALSLPKEVKVAWRFFGYELYGKRLDIFISEKSKQFIRKSKKSFSQNLLSLVKKVYHYLKYKGNPQNLFYSAIKRIDYMLVLSTEEYKLLIEYWSYLPEFIKLPYRHFYENITLPPIERKNESEKPVIVLGNNRSSYNNHLELIETIDRIPYKQHYQFTLLFNYGTEGEYARAVRENVKGKPYYDLIDEFIPSEEFKDFYQKISALVINGYRQMAGANIFMAIQNGVKVYLNEKNVFMQWLRNEGFIVFTINDFESDLKAGNVQLDTETAEKNLEQLKNFSKKYTKEDFQKVVYNKVTNNSLIT